MENDLENLLNEGQENVSNSNTCPKPRVLKRILNGVCSLVKNNSRVVGAVSAGIPVALAGAVVGEPALEYIFSSVSPSPNQFSTLSFPDNIILYGLGAAAALYTYGCVGAGLVRKRDE